MGLYQRDVEEGVLHVQGGVGARHHERHHVLPNGVHCGTYVPTRDGDAVFGKHYNDEEKTLLERECVCVFLSDVLRI